MKTCKHPACNTPALSGAWMCAEHVDQDHQCEGHFSDGRRCHFHAKPGTPYCGKHSGQKTAEIAAKSAALTAMKRFVQPFAGDLDPITAFELEFRRTYGRIVWLEDQISELRTEDLIFGVTKIETTTASEFPGTTTTSEARIHVYEEMLRWERKHLLDMEKLWIGAKLDQQKINVMRSNITYTYEKVIAAARILGHNPEDDRVRAKLAELFMGGEDGRSELVEG